MTGILFATLATIFVLGTLTAPLQHDPTNTIGVYIVMGGIGFIFAAIAYLLLRRTISIQMRPCPSCGSFERRPAGLLTRRRSLFLRHVGGFLLESLWGQSQRQQVACLGCENLYFTETKSTRAWGVAAWVLLLLLLFGALVNYLAPDK